jgi:hypothetical protein
MKKLLLIIPIVIGCSHELRVYSDYDRDFNVHEFKTYNWPSQTDLESKNNPLYYNELNDKRIKNAVDIQLKAKGMERTVENPGLMVHYHIVVEDRTSVTTDPYGSYGPYWTRTGLIQYREGTLILDFMDSKTNSLVWRGWAVSIVDNNEIDEETLIRAITGILKKFK